MRLYDEVEPDSPDAAAVSYEDLMDFVLDGPTLRSVVPHCRAFSEPYESK